MDRVFQRLLPLAALALLLPIAATQPSLDVTVCVATDKACQHPPVDGLPLETYLMNAEGAWGALDGLASPNATAGAAVESSVGGTHVRFWGRGDLASGGHATQDDGQAHAIACQDGCPDLTVDVMHLARNLRIRFENFKPGDCNIEEGNTQEGLRRVIRFATTTPNHGDGPLGLGDPTAAPDHFHWGTCHGHWHFDDYAAYRLWTRDGFDAWRDLRESSPDATASEILAQHPALASALVTGHKQGFCLMDIRRYHLERAPMHDGCGDQGITPGWADEYEADLDGQFIDITEVAGGQYVLEVEVNPDRTIEELGYSDNAAALLIVLPPWPE